MTKPKNERAKQHWSKIRNAVFGELTNLPPTDGLVKGAKSQQEDLILSHGIKLLSKFQIDYTNNFIGIHKVFQNKKQNCYIITFTDGNLCCLSLDNFKQENFYSQQPIYNIVYTRKYKSYVALCRDNSLRILREDFSVVNTIPHNGIINGLVYNAFTNEVISYGIGHIIIWIFRTAGTLVIPYRRITEKLQPDDLVSNVCIEQAASESQRCFAAVANEFLVYVLSSGECLFHIKDAHNCLITSILYYKPLKIFVTAANDGSIKTWTENWGLNCLFIGHTASVTSLAEFPYGPAIISSSLDGTVRTWSFDTKDEMHSFSTDKSLVGLDCNIGDKVFFSFSKRMVQQWKINNLHLPFTVLGSKPKLLRTTKYSLLPAITCSVCDDACVRLICPVSGEIVTVFISSDYTSINDVLTMSSGHLLYVLLMDGRILKVSYDFNPCKVISEWTRETMLVPASVSCISLFEYHSPKDDMSGGNEIMNDRNKEKVQQKLLFGGCVNGTVVLFNWKDDQKTGKVVFSLQAHREQVICMAVNTSLNQLATASQDMTLKVWRIFPFASEALAPLLMFLHTTCVSHLVFSHHSLGVVYQDAARSIHTFTVYKTKNVKKAHEIEHSIKDDHSDVITCLDSCPKLRIFATGSMDNSIRIWSSENILLRVLELNDIPFSLTFCTQRGDLMVGFGTNINMISHKTYLPKRYLYQMVAMVFLDSAPIQPIPVNELASNLNALDKRRLYEAHCSFIKFMKFVDEVPLEEQQRKEEEERRKKQEFAVLKSRDEELQKLVEGKWRPDHETTKKKKFPKKLQQEAFQKYLKLFYTRPDIPYPDDIEDIDQFEKCTEESFIVKIDDSYKPDFQPGFFEIKTDNFDLKRIKENIRKEHEKARVAREKLLGTFDETPIHKEKRSLSFAGDRVEELREKILLHPRLSASMSYVERLQALKELRKHPDKKDFSFCAPKLERIDLSAEEYPQNRQYKRNVNSKIVSHFNATSQQHHYDKNSRHNLLPIAPDGYLPNSVVVALYKELRREATPTGSGNKQWKPRGLDSRQLAELENVKSIEHIDGEEVKAISPLSSISRHKSKDEQVEQDSDYNLDGDGDGDNDSIARIPSLFKEVKLEMGVYDENATLDLKTPPQTPPKSPMQIRLENEIKQRKPSPKPRVLIKKFTPPPKLIEKQKPAVAVVNIPPPRPPTPIPAFVTQFKDADWFQKCFPVLNNQVLGKPCNVFMFVCLLLKKMETMRDYSIKTDIVSAILVLTQQETVDKTTIDLVRNSFLNELNLPDGKPNSKGPKEELEFIMKCIQTILEIDTLSPMLIVEMMVQYVLADILFRKTIMQTFYDLGLQDGKEYFQQQLTHGFNNSQTSSPSNKMKLRDECFDWLMNWSKKFKQRITSLSGKICRKKATKRVTNGSKAIIKRKDKQDSTSTIVKNKGISFVDEEFVNEAANHVSPIDVINYFCEMKFNEALEKLKREAVKRKDRSKEKGDKNKNAVLTTSPKQGYVSLARIGETHKSKCHPERETLLLSNCNNITTENNTIRSLMLHAKRVTLAPFPNELDELLYVHGIKSNLITLQYSQKYFIPSKSFVI